MHSRQLLYERLYGNLYIAVVRLKLGLMGCDSLASSSIHTICHIMKRDWYLCASPAILLYISALYQEYAPVICLQQIVTPYCKLYCKRTEIALSQLYDITERLICIAHALALRCIVFISIPVFTLHKLIFQFQ